MNAKLVVTGAAGLMLALTGCTKKTETPAVARVEPPKPVIVEVVKETERSRHFLAVNRQLELGGTLYGYVDVDGDVLKLVGGLHDWLQQIAKAQPNLAPLAKQDFAALLTTLGLTDIKAAGLSSVPEGNGFFRNRAFFYTAGQRHGLLAGLGGPAGPFVHVNLAPADADAYSEAEIDLPVVYRTIREVVTKIGGENTSTQFETTLRKAGENVALSVLDLIYGLKGHAAMVLRLDPERTTLLPGRPGVTLPMVSMLICVEGVAPVVEGALAKAKTFTRSQEGALRLYELNQPLPLEGIKPVLAVEGTTLYLASTAGFLKECREQKTGLAQSPEFRQALGQVGSEGNGLGYVSPRFFEHVRRFEALNPDLPADTKSIVHLVMANLPKPDRALVTVRTNLPDGILVRSYWNRSLKQEAAMVSVYNPITVGLIAAMAIPAFQKVRQTSQQKAVLNNLRQLAAAADQYYLERGVRTATYNDLVGPDKYIKAINPVAGENYRTLQFVQGMPLRVRLPDGRTVEYKP